MFGLFKKQENDVPERSEPEYPVVANLRIGATLNPSILDIALAKENGETVLLEKMPETLIINSVHSIDMEDAEIYRYLANSGEMVEITSHFGARPEDSEEVILYTLFDEIGFASDQDVEDWIAEDHGHMGQPVFSIFPDPETEDEVQYFRMIHAHSEHWAHPVPVDVNEVTGDPYDLETPTEEYQSEREMMLFGRDLTSINSHEQLLMDFDEARGVIRLYVGIPVKLNDLNIT